MISVACDYNLVITPLSNTRENAHWFSLPFFYAHTQGYKTVLMMKANGCGVKIISGVHMCPEMFWCESGSFQQCTHWVHARQQFGPQLQTNLQLWPMFSPVKWHTPPISCRSRVPHVPSWHRCPWRGCRTWWSAPLLYCDTPPAPLLRRSDTCWLKWVFIMCSVRIWTVPPLLTASKLFLEPHLICLASPAITELVPYIWDRYELRIR